MRIVVALGGNALLQRGEPPTARAQRRNAAVAAGAIAGLAREHDVVVTHGNGPQVGLLALQGEALDGVEAYPLDVLGAESEGMIGYVLEQELANELRDRHVATLLTQVVVDAMDPAFENPTKPIGPLLEPEAAKRAAERGWAVGRDSEAYRRVVASPEPRSIVELPTIELLVASGVLVICAGGGGIPVVADDQKKLRGVEAVIDKDLVAALLAEELGAEALLLLTDVPAVEADWGTPDARPFAEISADDIRRLSFAPGSMGPKVVAARRFVEAGGGLAAIGALADGEAILRGERGTRVTR